MIFFSTSYFAPFKGFHTLLKALAVVKLIYPNLKLNVIGPALNYIHPSAYEKYIMSIIKKNKLTDNVFFHGRLSSAEIIRLLLDSDIFVNPSYVESYSVSTAESLYLGVPSLLAYSGALPEFQNNSNNVDFYTPTDYKACASKLIEMFVSDRFVFNLHDERLKTYRDAFDPKIIASKQIDIYEQIIASCK